MSRLIRRLRDELARATRPSDRIDLGASLALQLARVGKFEEAKQNLKLARSLFVDGHGGLGTVRVMLAEALLLFYEHQSPQAKVRVSAAQALAVAIGQPRLIAITSAWKSHIHFEHSEFAAMSESLDSAMAHATEDDLDAITRAAIVLFNGFATSGELDRAQGWFFRAHSAAIKNGDQASVDALLYNKMVLVLGHLRVKQSANCLNVNEVQRVRREFMSSENLTALTGISALASHVPFANSRLSMLEEKFEQAAALLAEVRDQGPFSKKNFSQSYIDLEICFCNYKLGKREEVANYLKNHQVSEFENLDIDENIASIWMRQQMASEYSEFGEPGGLQQRLSTLCVSYFENRKELVKNIGRFA